MQLLRGAWVAAVLAAIVGCAAPGPSTAPSPTSTPTAGLSGAPSLSLSMSPSLGPATSPSPSTPPTPTGGQTPAPSAPPTVDPTNAEGFTADEQQLVDIAAQYISANIDGVGGTACKSKSNSLPTKATAGVEC